MKLKNFVVGAVSAVLTVSLGGCNINKSLPEVEAIIQEVDDIDFSSTDSVTRDIEKKFNVDISDELSEFMDDESVLSALNGEATRNDGERVLDLSLMELSQKIQEDNLEMIHLGLSTNEDGNIVSGESVYETDSYLNDYIMSIYRLSQALTDCNDVSQEAREVAKKMVSLSLVKVDVDQAFIGNGEIKVMELK